jgi:hypothetical protein
VWVQGAVFFLDAQNLPLKAKDEVSSLHHIEDALTHTLR